MLLRAISLFVKYSRQVRIICGLLETTCMIGVYKKHNAGEELACMQSKSNTAQDPATGGYSDVRLFYKSRGSRVGKLPTDCCVTIENHCIKDSTQKYTNQKNQRASFLPRLDICLLD